MATLSATVLTTEVPAASVSRIIHLQILLTIEAQQGVVDDGTSALVLDDVRRRPRYNLSF